MSIIDNARYAEIGKQVEKKVIAHKSAQDVISNLKKNQQLGLATNPDMWYTPAISPNIQSGLAGWAINNPYNNRPIY